jgi:hypothetical protein
LIFIENAFIWRNIFMRLSLHLLAYCFLSLSEKYCLVLAAESLICWPLLPSGRILG